MSRSTTAGETTQSSPGTTDNDSLDTIDTREASDAVLNHNCDDLIDEVILGLCFEIHRSVKMGTFFLNDVDETNEKEYEIVDEIGLDVFGQVPMKKQLECVCPNCQRNLAASRFAPHLEKCMGMGRSSSRIANRRIANTSCGVLKDIGGSSGSSTGGGASGAGGTGSVAATTTGGCVSSSEKAVISDQDDDNDDDWTYNLDRKGPKKKRDKNSNHSLRRSKTNKMKNGETTGVGLVSCSSDATAALYPNYENMSVEDRKVLLVQMCGVISEHTRRMCTRSHRCPQHTDEQRKAVRVTLLGPQMGSNLEVNESIQVDTLDDLEGQLLRETLWESGTSANPSPTDSTSTNNSTTSSKKRSKIGATKRNKKSRPPNTKITAAASHPSTSLNQEQCS